MGCNCSSDYDDDWVENLDEVCDNCNCPIPTQSANPVSVCVFVCVDSGIASGRGWGSSVECEEEGVIF